MEKPNIIKQEAFGGDWYMFYCGKCGKTIDCNVHPEKCSACDEEIDYPTPVKK